MEMEIEDNMLRLAELAQALKEMGFEIFKSRMTGVQSGQTLSDNCLHPQVVQGQAVIAQLKELNREATARTKLIKALPLAKRGEMDSAYLQLQNLGYERNHLEMEILRCKQYESEFQNVPLHDIEEYKRLCDDKSIPEDQHELMLIRLRFELSERQRLEKERKDLIAEKSKLTKENEETKARLEDLEKQLDGFISTSKVIQQKLADF